MPRARSIRLRTGPVASFFSPPSPVDATEHTEASPLCLEARLETFPALCVDGGVRGWARGTLLLRLGLVLAAASALATGVAGAAGPPLRLSTDPYTNASSQHRTEVEPDSFAFGSTMVAAFQVGRFTDGGAS